MCGDENIKFDDGSDGVAGVKRCHGMEFVRDGGAGWKVITAFAEVGRVVCNTVGLCVLTYTCTIRSLCFVRSFI